MKRKNNVVVSLKTGLRKYSIYVIMVLLFFVCALLNKNFLSVSNLTNILRQISVTTILAFGETMLVIAGLIDLASGAVLALAGVVSIAVFKSTGSLWIAFLVGIGLGVLLNLLSGILVAYAKTPPFIATLAITMVARGFALLFTNGQNIYQIGKYIIFGQGSLFGIPVPIIFMLLMFILTWYILQNTRFGRSLYAIGGNEEAAVASGIRVTNVKFYIYLVNGVLVGLAGILLMSRVNAGLPNAANGYEFEALTATIIGGTSFSGGLGTATGTIAGAFIVGFLNNIMNLLGVNSYVQQIVKGIIIALAVAFDIAAKNRRSKPREIATETKSNVTVATKNVK
ncbi:MAG: ABC transporter permease [Sphaerochaetaceae bacterium]